MQSTQTKLLVMGQPGEEIGRESEGEQPKLKSHSQNHHSRVLPEWKHQEHLKRMKRKRYGQHYNYDYRKPIQHKMYRLQQNQNTEIEKANRMLLEKIQTIFKRSSGYRREAEVVSETTTPTNNQPPRSQSHYISNMKTNERMFYKDKGGCNPHDYTFGGQPVYSYGNERKNSQSDMTGNMGSLNKKIELAKYEMLMHQNHVETDRINEGELNRNLVKLTAIDPSHTKPRQHFNESPNSVFGGRHSLLNSKTKGNVSQDKTIEMTPNEQVYLDDNICSLENDQNDRQVKKSKENKRNYCQNFPKIILYKQDNFRIEDNTYNIQMYVENSVYTLNTKCLLPTGEQLNENITLPYQNYQQLYQKTLHYRHEKLLDYLRIKPTTQYLQIEGVEQKYLILFQYLRDKKQHDRLTGVEEFPSIVSDEIEKEGECKKSVRLSSELVGNNQSEELSREVQREAGDGPLSSEVKLFEKRKKMETSREGQVGGKREEEPYPLTSKVQFKEMPGSRKSSHGNSHNSSMREESGRGRKQESVELF